ncbi:MAG: Ferric siderophore transport system, periplasmic binding protein TonB [Polyangiaceae bacterium]|jgi:protein TonB|nr:Ferric siderophore transport system, periplasmic binding protein TonB [Polyangiaceae bacterium]
MKTRRLLPWTVALSFLLHGVAYASLQAPPASKKAEHGKTQLRFEVVSKPEPPKPLEAPEPPPPEPPKPARAQQPKPVAKAEPPPVDAPPPARTDGVTLASEGAGNAFSMPLGNGGSLEPTSRPRPPTPVNVPAPTLPAPTRVVTEPPVVAVSDLSSRPSPPSLADALQRNYPAAARRSGQSGSAKVRARIDPDGVVRRVTLVEESGAGFGAACSRSLNGSRWAAPKDKAGRSVATEIRYTCRFVVQ